MASLIAFLTWAFAHSEDFNKVALALVALVGLVLSPMIQCVVVAWQMRVQRRIANLSAIDNISAKRQVWIDGVRNDAAEFLAHTAMLATLRSKYRRVEGHDAKQEVEERMLTAFGQAEICGSRLELRLNPNETAHQELIAIAKAFDLTAKRFFDEPGLETLGLLDTYQTQRAEIISRLQGILKTEWTRIKEARV